MLSDVYDITCDLSGQTFDTFYDSPPKNQPKSVTKKIVIQRLIFGSRLHHAPHMGDMDESNHKRRNSQVIGVHGVFHFDLREDFSSSNRAPFVGRLSYKVSVAR